MANRFDAVSAAVLGAVALMLAADAAAARPVVVRGGTFSNAHASLRPPTAAPLRHHRRLSGRSYWPGDYADPAYGAPLADAPTAAAPSGDDHYTYEVPWDWAHRWPPQVTPSDHPYVPSCPTETVTVTGRNGQTQAVNITRCY